MTKAIYEYPEFQVRLMDNTSEWKTQETGIRQGCPLSPYLFIIVATVMFQRLKDRDKGNMMKARPDSASVDEVLYTDDTILISMSGARLSKYFKNNRGKITGKRT